MLRSDYFPIFFKCKNPSHATINPRANIAIEIIAKTQFSVKKYPCEPNVKYKSADIVVTKTNSAGITMNLTFIFFERKKDATAIIVIEAIN